MKQKKYRNLLPFAEAKEVWATKLAAGANSPLAHETVPLAEAQGRTLAVAEAARVSSPAFHGAAMDGIAVVAEDTFGASTQKPKSLFLHKNAFWVNTGRPLPDNCNAVIMSENITPGQGDTVIIEQAAFPWQHVRKMGEDMVATEIILPPGVRIGAYELGALAAGGVLNPTVFARPKVAIIPSGSEIVPLKEATPALLASGDKIPEFNSLILKALIEDCGGEALVQPIVPDDPQLIANALKEASKLADLVVMVAGTSAGSRDFTPEVIAEKGELWVHGVSIMPGKPTSLGMIYGKPFIGVPGYPVSAIIAFEEFGQSLLCLWQKRGLPERIAAHASPYQPLPSKPGLEERVRVKLGKVEDKLFAIPLPRGAGTMTSLTRADGIISIAPSIEGLPGNEPVPVALIRDKKQIDGALLAIGSHDNALELLDSFLRRKHPPFSLTSAHVGSMGGLVAIKNRQCHLAGSHLLDPATGVYNQASVKELLGDMPVVLMRLVDREQCLILPKGNPLGIRSFADLARPDVTFINRQRGSGTRVLLDWELSRLHLNPADIAGYEEEEYTHMNVAVAVLAGRASVGLGVQAAANALGLDFVPVGMEEYDLVIPATYWEDERIQAMTEIVRSNEFKKAVSELGGYGVSKTGTVIWQS